MRHILKWIFLFCILSLSAFASEGDEVGNGDGMGPRNMTFAYLNLEKYVDICLSSEACRLTNEERVILANIRTSLPEERAANTAPIFKSEQANSGFFIIDGEQKIAKTGMTVGSPIFVNTDLLYTHGAAGETVPLGISSGTAILVHELGHHQGITDHTALDALGAKVEISILNHTQEIDLGWYNRNIVARAIDFESTHAITQIFVSDGAIIEDLTDTIRPVLTCPFEDSRLSGAWILNLHWLIGSNPSNTTIWNQPMQAWANVFCEFPEGQISQILMQLKINLVFDWHGYNNISSFWLVPNSATAELINCAETPELCHK